MSTDPSHKGYSDPELIERYLDGSLDEQGLMVLQERLHDETFAYQIREVMESHRHILNLTSEVNNLQGVHVSDTSAISDEQIEQAINKVINRITTQPPIEASSIDDEQVEQAINKVINRITTQPHVEAPTTIQAAGAARSAQSTYRSRRRSSRSASNQRTQRFLWLGATMAMAACMVAGFFLYSFSQQKVSDSILAQISPSLVEVSGKVSVEHNRINTIPEMLSPGAQVITSSESSALIRYADLTSIRLAANSQIRIQKQSVKNEENKRLSITRGSLTANVTQQAEGNHIYIRTPHAEVKVLGTAFDLAVTPEYSELKVNEGLVLVSDLKGEQQNVVHESYQAKLGDDIFEVVHLTDPRAHQTETSFTLINVDSGQAVPEFDPIPEGAVIDFSEIGTRNINIRINTSDDVIASYTLVNGTGPVHITPEDKTITKIKTHVEFVKPFTVAGDSLDSGYSIWYVPLGTYTIETKLYLESKKLRFDMSQKELREVDISTIPVDEVVTITIRFQE